MKTAVSKFFIVFNLMSVLIFIGCGEKKDKSTEGEMKEAKTPVAIYQVKALTNKEYTFNGADLKNAENPELTLKRGETYQFEIDAYGHNFYIKDKQVPGKEGTYDNGVTKNGVDEGTLSFTVPMDAPNILFYVCKFHKMMSGKLLIVD